MLARLFIGISLFAAAICYGVERPCAPILDTVSAAKLIASSSHSNLNYRLHGQILFCGKDFLILDDKLGQVYISTSGPAEWKTGDTVTVDCTTIDDLRYRAGGVAKAVSVRVSATGTPPAAQAVTPTDVVRGDGFQRIDLEGVLTGVQTDEIDPEWTILHIEDERSRATVWGKGPFFSNSSVASLVDARVRLRGVRFPKGDLSLRHYIGPWVLADADRPVEIVIPPPSDPFASALPPPHRNQIEGTVLVAWNGDRIFLSADDGRKVEVLVDDPDTLPKSGSRVLVVGFVRHNTFFTYMTNARLRTIQDGGSPSEAPKNMRIKDLFRTTDGLRRIDPTVNGRLIRLAGVVRGYHGQPGKMTTARLEGDGEELDVAIGDFHKPPIGARVRVTGVGRLLCEKNMEHDEFVSLTGLSLLIRDAADIEILETPSWWTPVRLRITLGISLLLLIGIFVWNLTLRVLVHRRSRQLLRESVERIRADLRTDERTRLSVELHDTIAQNLTGASLEINAVRRILDKGGQDCRPHLDRAERTVTSCRTELRNCIWDLRCHALALPSMADAVRQTVSPHIGEARLSIRFNVPRTRLSDNTAHALLSILRELCINAVKHGKATSLRIAGSIEGDRLLFSVRDNGRGFDPKTALGIADGHFGLQGIQERANRQGGDVTIVSTPESGTKVTVSFAIRHQQGNTAS